MEAEGNSITKVQKQQGYDISSPYNIRKIRKNAEQLFSTKLCTNLDHVAKERKAHFPPIQLNKKTHSSHIVDSKFQTSPSSVKKHSSKTSQLPAIRSASIKQESRTLSWNIDELNSSHPLHNKLFDFRQPRAQEKAKRKQVRRLRGDIGDAEIECDTRYVKKPYEGSCDKFEYFSLNSLNKKKQNLQINEEIIRGRGSDYNNSRRSSSHSPKSCKRLTIEKQLQMVMEQRSSTPSSPAMARLPNHSKTKTSRYEKMNKKSKKQLTKKPHLTEDTFNNEINPHKRVIFNTCLPIASPEFHRAMKGIATPRHFTNGNSLDFSDSSSEGRSSPSPRKYKDSFKRSHSNTVTFSGTSVKLYGGNIENEMADQLGTLDDSFAPRKSILKNRRRRSIDDLDVSTKKGLADYLESKMLQQKSEKLNEKDIYDTTKLLTRLNT